MDCMYDAELNEVEDQDTLRCMWAEVDTGIETVWMLPTTQSLEEWSDSEQNMHVTPSPDCDTRNVDVRIDSSKEV